ncbi:hypothetical protein QYE76_015324 [Lolium multiflorum]|uniref:Reverse transcriptase zinc-binding domain-containing protein n=1 Tax=Lolium multiflorum TaxID=4521 RepID=A0AAD8X940_LOLMU|nr:hypothetical protein QYE76_015324 [Lolium multiflorum]
MNQSDSHRKFHCACGLSFSKCTPLAERFPAIFSHCTRLHASVATVVALGLDLQPRLSSAAEAELLHIRCLIDDTRFGDAPDTRVIDSPSAPSFCSREAYRMLSPPRPRDASACIAWGLRLPSKLKIFIYLLDIDRLSTRANLFYKSCAPSDVCAACPEIETGRHLFFDCRLASDLWAQLDVPIPAGPFSVWTSVPLSPSPTRHGSLPPRRSSGPSGKVAMTLYSTGSRPPPAPRFGKRVTIFSFGGGDYRLLSVRTSTCCALTF